MKLHFLNDVVYDVELTQKSIITPKSLVYRVNQLINRIPGSPLSISSLPGRASRMHVEWLGKPRDSTSILEALPGKLDIKRHSPSILYVTLIVCIDAFKSTFLQTCQVIFLSSWVEPSQGQRVLHMD